MDKHSVLPSLKSKLLLAILTPALLGSAGLVYKYFYQPSMPIQNAYQTRVVIEFPIDQARLLDAFKKFPVPKAGDNTNHVTAGIAPHHALASTMIAEFFSELKKHQDVKRFVIIGPNHPDAGTAHAITARFGWQTPEGILSADHEAASALVKAGVAKEDDSIIASEHSIYTLAPFIKHYFPQAQIVPLIVSSKQTLDESRVLASELATLLDHDTVLVASVDFSHYLPSDVAKQKDVLMEKYLKEKQFNHLASLQSDYLDSPQSIITTLMVAHNAQADTPTIIRHTTSAEFVGRDIESSTSYFTILFTRATSSQDKK